MIVISQLSVPQMQSGVSEESHNEVVVATMDVGRLTFDMSVMLGHNTRLLFEATLTLSPSLFEALSFMCSMAKNGAAHLHALDA